MQILHPPDWAPPIGYSNGIMVAPGQIVFIAGQVGWNRNQVFESEDLVPQFEQALKNLLSVLSQGGGDPGHICRMGDEDIGAHLRDEHHAILPIGETVSALARSALHDGFSELNWAQFKSQTGELIERMIP